MFIYLYQIEEILFDYLFRANFFCLVIGLIPWLPFGVLEYVFTNTPSTPQLKPQINKQQGKLYEAM